jgi:hypothetical protein
MWEIILLVGFLVVISCSVLMVGGTALSQRVTPTDDPGATRAPMIQVEQYPLQTVQPESVPWYLLSSSVPTRNLDL